MYLVRGHVWKNFETRIRDAFGERRKRVVVVTDYPAVLKGAEVYVADDRGSQIGIIVDSVYVLSGEYGDGSMNTCLYSGQSNFVKLFKSAMAK